MQHFIDDGQWLREAVAHQHTIITLQDNRRNAVSCAVGGIDHGSDIGKIHGGRYDQNIRLGRITSDQFIYSDGQPYTQSQSTGRLWVMADHGGFSNDGFRDGFHRHVTNDGGRFVDADQADITQGDTRFFHQHVQRLIDAENVALRPFDTGSLRHSAGNKLQLTVSCNLRQCHFR